MIGVGKVGSAEGSGRVWRILDPSTSSRFQDEARGASGGVGSRQSIRKMVARRSDVVGNFDVAGSGKKKKIIFRPFWAREAGRVWGALWTLGQSAGW